MRPPALDSRPDRRAPTRWTCSREESEMSATVKMPPTWVVHLAWRIHRALYRVSGGRFLWTPASKRGWGALRLTAIGRKSGQERSVILGYIEDGDNLVTMAMNGWAEPARPPGSDRAPARWRDEEGARPGSRRGRARPPVATLARGREGRSRRLRRPAEHGDAGGGVGASGGVTRPGRRRASSRRENARRGPGGGPQGTDSGWMATRNRAD